jgi:hypothetical protein
LMIPHKFYHKGNILAPSSPSQPLRFHQWLGDICKNTRDWNSNYGKRGYTVLRLFRFTLTQLLLPKDTKSTSTDEPSGQSLTVMQVVILPIVLVGELIHPFWVGSNCMTA